jgi:hypothetical protein
MGKKVDTFAQSKGSAANKAKEQREQRDPCNNPDLANLPMCKRKRAKPRQNGSGSVNPSRTEKNDIYGPSRQ